MKYHDSQEKSAEYLRRVIPLMSRQAAAFHPISYAVWYEYAAGINPALKADIDALLEASAVLDESAIFTLHQKHIAELDEESAQRVGSGLQRVLAEMTLSAEQAGNEASRFGSALEQWSDGLTEPGASAKLGAEADKLLHDTRQMHDAVKSLSGRLSESQNEIDRLRQEVRRPCRWVDRPCQSQRIRFGVSGLFGLNRTGDARPLPADDRHRFLQEGE